MCFRCRLGSAVVRSLRCWGPRLSSGGPQQQHWWRDESFCREEMWDWRVLVCVLCWGDGGSRRPFKLWGGGWLGERVTRSNKRCRIYSWPFPPYLRRPLRLLQGFAVPLRLRLSKMVRSSPSQCSHHSEVVNNYNAQSLNRPTILEQVSVLHLSHVFSFHVFLYAFLVSVDLKN